MPLGELGENIYYSYVYFYQPGMEIVSWKMQYGLMTVSCCWSNKRFAVFLDRGGKEKKRSENVIMRCAIILRGYSQTGGLFIN